VLASYSDHTVMGNDLQSTLAALFTNENPQAPVVLKASVSTSAPTTSEVNTLAGLRVAAAHYNQALQALRQGDWALFGAEIRKLGEDLGQPSQPVHQ
jgi:uncharacterized membrane protein (UPF0182 family)